MKKKVPVWGIIFSFFLWACHSPDYPSLDKSPDSEKIATLDVNSDLSKIPLDSILRSGKMKLITKDFTKTIIGIKPSTNTHLENSEIFASDSIVFILRNKVDLTFSVTGKEGRNFHYVVSRDKTHILDLKAAYLARKAKVSAESLKDQNNKMSNHTEQFASNSYCFASNEIPTKDSDKNVEQNKDFCGSHENEGKPLAMSAAKGLSGEKTSVVDGNKKSSGSKTVTIKLLFTKHHGTLWHEVDWAFGKFIKSMRNVAPEVQFNLVRVYNKIDDLPNRNGKLLFDLRDYIYKKRSMNDPLYTENNTIFVAVGFDICSWGAGAFIYGQALSQSYDNSYDGYSHGIAISNINLFSLPVLGHEIAHTLGANHNDNWYWHKTWWIFGYWWRDIMQSSANIFGADYHADSDNIRRMRVLLRL
ncbi:hypothetical protein [Elizabethkingia ursingii]|uniref:Peptidase M12B domain-containing protein n=1 Tax=Elizabethkingia ursingii TaxID=1756150 RepID=A0ABX3ND97_9FLAO|nr:hypothetical protein [Elizabethkingia ursingii]OPB94526.1 hypothetical protein BB021_18160 [Elizabethkingia ursingii]